MEISFRGVIAAFFLVFISASASAALIDEGSYTVDTVSGLDWLDVSSSTSQSYNYVSSQFEAGGEYEGWRYAYKHDYIQLISNASGADAHAGSNVFLFDEVNNHSAADILVRLLGVTVTSSSDGDDIVFGMLGNSLEETFPGHPYGDVKILGEIYDSDRNDAAKDHSVVPGHWQLVQSINSQVGSYLIRDSKHAEVPEPRTMFMLMLGLLGLGCVRKKNWAR